MKPFKKTIPIVEETPDEEHKLIHKNIKEEIVAPTGVKKEKIDIVFEDSGIIKNDLLKRLQYVMSKSNWKLRQSLLEKINSLI